LRRTAFFERARVAKSEGVEISEFATFSAPRAVIQRIVDGFSFGSRAARVSEAHRNFFSSSQRQRFAPLQRWRAHSREVFEIGHWLAARTSPNRESNSVSKKVVNEID
jgi:hypothetical protein